MNLIEIADVADPRLDPYRDLKSEDVRRRGELFIAEGRLVVQRLLQSRYQTVSVLAEAKRLDWVRDLVRPETPVLVVPPTLIREVSGFNFHRGLLACGRREPFLPAQTLLPPGDRDQNGEVDAGEGSGWRPGDFVPDPSRIALAAISLNDQENLGSLIRTSAAFGIETFVVNRQTVDPLCRRVLRVSMGTALRMRFIDLDDTLGWLIDNERRGGWFTIATTLAKWAIPLSHVTRHPAYASRPKLLLMGNEGDGLPADVVSACTAAAVIPMAVGVDSLNVSVAGAIAIYELVRSGT
jgi:tRNA G18 (ribose-2'-O)-methylase SpoU